MTIDVDVLRSELMKFSKEELITELLAALLELTADAENGGSNRRTPLVSRPHSNTPEK